jgi:amidohydrolase
LNHIEILGEIIVGTKWSKTLNQRASDISKELIAIRRQIHRNPELGFREKATSQLICEKLKDLGIKFRKGVGNTGVIGVIAGRRGGKTIGLRADMDAVPVQEETGLSYASKNPGIMHACGHDAHIACLLGAAKLLVSFKDQFTGNIKLFFQPAEEIDQGAKAMISEGGLENPKPDAFLALHVAPELPVGTVGIKEGPMMAAIDTMRITVAGKGGHGAMPHQCIDAIVAASAIVVNLQTTVSREIDPVKPTVVSIGTFHGGEAENIIASKVNLTGTVRTIDPDVHQAIPKIIERICRNTAASFGARISFDYQELIPSLINCKEITNRVVESSKAILGLKSVMSAPVSMGGDDFAFFLKEVPGSYFHFGTKDANSEAVHALHNGYFDIDERSLHLGAAILAHTALITLEG